GGRYGSGGLGRGCSVRAGFGDAAEGDFETEGSELADVVGDLAAGVALALVVVRAEVLIISCRGWIAACGRPSAWCSRWRRMLWPCRVCGRAAGAGRPTLGRGDAKQTRLAEQRLEETREKLIGAAGTDVG